MRNMHLPLSHEVESGSVTRSSIYFLLPYPRHFLIQAFVHRGLVTPATIFATLALRVPRHSRRKPCCRTGSTLISPTAHQEHARHTHASIYSCLSYAPAAPRNCRPRCQKPLRNADRVCLFLKSVDQRLNVRQCCAGCNPTDSLGKYVSNTYLHWQAVGDPSAKNSFFTDGPPHNVTARLRGKRGSLRY